MYSGIPVHIYLVKQWNVCMVDTCVTDLPLKMASIMTCGQTGICSVSVLINTTV